MKENNLSSLNEIIEYSMDFKSEGSLIYNDTGRYFHDYHNE